MLGKAIAKRLIHSQHLPYFLQIMHFIIQHIVTMLKYGHGELNIHRPYITESCDIRSFRVSGRKMAERFQKVMTSQEHQTINNAVLY